MEGLTYDEFGILRDPEREGHLYDEVVSGLYQGDYESPSAFVRHRVGQPVALFDLGGMSNHVEGREGDIRVVCFIHDWEVDWPDQVRIVAKTVDACVAKGLPTLVSCAAGLNRSGIVVARALMYDGYDAESAVGLVRMARGRYALCNEDFVDWLHGEEGKGGENHG